MESGFIEKRMWRSLETDNNEIHKKEVGYLQRFRGLPVLALSVWFHSQLVPFP